MSGIPGIDVSDWQGNVNWSAVANDNMSYGITKATEGTSFIAETFSKNWSAIQKAGLVRGAYHFFRAKESGRAQAEKFLSVVKISRGDFPPVLDIESSDGVDSATIRHRMVEWLDIVEKETKRKPIIYTFPTFWERIGNYTEFATYPLWIAHYTSDSQPFVPGGWDTWTLWQYTDRGSVSGVQGGVDVNWFNIAIEGDRNQNVKHLQKTLHNKGFLKAPVDGYFGKSTKQALMAYQKAAGLKVDGIMGPNTWSLLTDLTYNPSPSKPTPSPQPTPSPNPTPSPSPTPSPEPSPGNGFISSDKLVEVCRSYKGLPHQDRALEWLQDEVPLQILRDFTRRWRNQDMMPLVAAKLTDVCRYYQQASYQDQALTWLQSQIADSTFQQFLRRWRNESTDPGQEPIKLVNVGLSYQGLPHQNQALQWLQSQIPQEILDEFARRWRK
jgi:lysozyme